MSVPLLLIAFGVYQCDQHLGFLFQYSSVEELKRNWDWKADNIQELQLFYDEIVPQGFVVYVEFKRNGTIDFWVHEENKAPGDRYIKWFQEWNLDLDNYKTPDPQKRDSTSYAPKTRSLKLILEKINWNRNTFNEIKKYLDRANCISINNSKPAKIGFKRSGMGKYYYLLFENPIPESRWTEYNDSCSYLFINGQLVFHYGGGAFGSQCFPDFR